MMAKYEWAGCPIIPDKVGAVWDVDKNPAGPLRHAINRKPGQTHGWRLGQRPVRLFAVFVFRCVFYFPVRLLFSGSSFTFWCAFLLFWFHNCSFYSTLSFPRTLQMADFVTSKAIPLPTWRKKKVYFSFFSYIIYMCVQYICYNCICSYKLSEIYCSFGIGDEWELGERVIYEYIYRYLRI